MKRRFDPDRQSEYQVALDQWKARQQWLTYLMKEKNPDKKKIAEVYSERQAFERKVLKIERARGMQ